MSYLCYKGYVLDYLGNYAKNSPPDLAYQYSLVGGGVLHGDASAGNPCMAAG